METYCVSCKKYSEEEDSSVRKTNKNRLMFLWNCAVFGKRNSTFVKNKELHNFD